MHSPQTFFLPCLAPVGRSAGSGPPWTRCRVHWTTSVVGGGPDRKCTESPETHIARVRSAIGGGRLRSGPVDHPSAHLFGRRLDRTSAARRGSAAHHASAGQVRWVSGAVMMILTLKKENRWSSGPVQLDHPGWRHKVAQSHFQAISGRRPLDHPPWSKVVQGGPAWSRVVQTVQSEYTPRRAFLR